MSQEQRDRVMRRFREGTTELLIATDVAARGLDIGHLSHVVNFDIPSAPDAYVHRIGRTGRAGREGVAITLLEPREMRHLRSIEHVGKRKIPVESVPTVMDLRARRMELTSAALRELLEAGELEPYGVIVESLANEFEVLDIARAAVKLAHEMKAPEGSEEEIAAPAPRPERPRQERPRRQRDGGEARVAKGGSRRPRRESGDSAFVRIYVPLGRRAGVRPGDLVGAIANEARVDSQMIGAIDITDNFSLVEVPERSADEIVQALRNTTIRGKRVKVRRERP
jgi:ATP-dependent RNA helicase DeaD